MKFICEDDGGKCEDQFTDTPSRELISCSWTTTIVDLPVSAAKTLDQQFPDYDHSTGLFPKPCMRFSSTMSAPAPPCQRLCHHRSP
jgi:hypothetical protein